MFVKGFSDSSHGAKIDQKCSQNHPRSSQVVPKMAILALSQPIFSLMLAYLGALGRYLAPLVRHLGANMSKHSQQNASVELTSPTTAPKMPQPRLPSTPKV